MHKGDDDDDNNTSYFMVISAAKWDKIGIVRIHVTLRLALEPLLQWKAISITYCKSVCSLTACNAHAPFCHVRPVPPYVIFKHYLITIFEKKIVTEHRMCVLISSTAFVWNISHSKKNWSRYDQKRILVFMWSTRYSCPIVMKLEFSGQFFLKLLKYKISSISVHWESSCSMRADRRTDRHDEANSSFSQFCEHA